MKGSADVGEPKGDDSKATAVEVGADAPSQPPQLGRGAGLACPLCHARVRQVSGLMCHLTRVHVGEEYLVEGARLLTAAGRTWCSDCGWARGLKGKGCGRRGSTRAPRGIRGTDKVTDAKDDCEVNDYSGGDAEGPKREARSRRDCTPAPVTLTRGVGGDPAVSPADPVGVDAAAPPVFQDRSETAGEVLGAAADQRGDDDNMGRGGDGAGKEVMKVVLALMAVRVRAGLVTMDKGRVGRIKLARASTVAAKAVASPTGECLRAKTGARPPTSRTSCSTGPGA